MAPGDEYFANLVKVDVSYAGERNTAQNVIYLTSTGAHGASLSQLAALAESISGLWGTNFLPLIGESITMTMVSAADWTSAEGLTGEYIHSVVGGMSGGALTDQVCTLLNYDTALRYRGGRGRLYLPQPSDSALSTGQLYTNTFVGDVEAAAVTVLAGINELDLASAPCVWSLYHRGSTHVTKGTEPVVEITASSTPATQRRRVRRVGHKA